MTKAKTYAFTDDKGNRFVVPSYINYGDKMMTDIWAKAQLFTVAVNVSMEEFEFEPENFPHFVIDIGSRGFLHGSTTVYLFAGPEFEKGMQDV